MKTLADDLIDLEDEVAAEGFALTEEDARLVMEDQIVPNEEDARLAAAGQEAEQWRAAEQYAEQWLSKPVPEADKSRRKAIVDRYKGESGDGDIEQSLAELEAEVELEWRSSQRDAVKNASDPIMVESVRDMLNNLNNRPYVLEIMRSMAPRQREEALRLAPGIAQELGDDRGNYLTRLATNVATGITDVSQPIMEWVGAGGTDEEIEFIRQLQAQAEQEFAPARADDPWYEYGSIGAGRMAPFSLAAGGMGWGWNLGARAGGQLLARGASAGVPGAKTAFQAIGAVGRAPKVIGLKGLTTKQTMGAFGTVAGVTSVGVPMMYATEKDELRAMGMEDNLTMKALALGTAIVASSLEAIMPNPLGRLLPKGSVSFKVGALKAARQYLVEAAKRAPAEMSEEYAQGFASGLGKVVANWIDENTEDRTLGDAFRTSFEQGNAALLPMMFMLGTPAVGGAVLSARRARMSKGGATADNLVKTHDVMMAMAELNAPPKAHKWANIVLGDRNLYEQAPSPKEIEKHYLAAKKYRSGMKPPPPVAPFPKAPPLTPLPPLLPGETQQPQTMPGPPPIQPGQSPGQAVPPTLPDGTQPWQSQAGAPLVLPSEVQQEVSGGTLADDLMGMENEIAQMTEESKKLLDEVPLPGVNVDVLPTPNKKGLKDESQIRTEEGVQAQGDKQVQPADAKAEAKTDGTEVQVEPPGGKSPWELTRAEHVAERERLIGEFRRLSDVHGGGPAAMQVPEVAAAFRAQEKWGDLDIGHKPAVQKAIKEGKPVPDSVLAEYPGISVPSKTTPTTDVAKPPVSDMMSQKDKPAEAASSPTTTAPVGSVTAYHGRRAVFPVSEFRVGGESSLLGRGIWFTDDEHAANTYSSTDPSVNVDVPGQIEALAKELDVSYKEAKKLWTEGAKPNVVKVSLDIKRPLDLSPTTPIKVSEQQFNLAASEADITLPENAYKTFVGKGNAKEQIDYLQKIKAGQMVSRIASIQNHDAIIFRDGLAPRSKGTEYLILDKAAIRETAPPAQKEPTVDFERTAERADVDDITAAISAAFDERFEGKSAEDAEPAKPPKKSSARKDQNKSLSESASSSPTTKPSKDAFPLAGAVVDGRTVRTGTVPNMDSIDAELSGTEYKVLPGIREVPMSAFPGLTGRHYSVQGTLKISQLQDKIAKSGKITPLIVVIDNDGPYILEGATRSDALFNLKAKSFPAVVVDARSTEVEQPTASSPTTKAEPDRVKQIQDSFPVSKEEAIAADILMDAMALPGEVDIAPPGTPMPKKAVTQISKASARMKAEGKSYSSESAFFKMWDKFLRAVGGKRLSLKSTTKAVEEAVEDIASWIEANPQYLDYYAKDMQAERDSLVEIHPELRDDANWALFKVISGIASNNAPLEGNVTEQINAYASFANDGRVDATAERSETGRGEWRVGQVGFTLYGGAQGVKALHYQTLNTIIEQQGGAEGAVTWLMGRVKSTPSGIESARKSVGLGPMNGSNRSGIKTTVEAATGQRDEIPRAFAIFGPKVGAYVLNHLGQSEYTTVDVWESRFWRSFFKDVPASTGLEEDTKTRAAFIRAANAFAEMLGLSPSAAQAARWFYVIQKMNEAGYTYAREKDRVSVYTAREVAKRQDTTGADAGGKRKAAKPKAGRRSSSLRSLLGGTIFGEVATDTLYQSTIDADAIPVAVLDKMSRRLKSMGYDSRGAEDVRRAIKQSSLLDHHADYIAAYQFATGSEQARSDKAVVKKNLKHVNWARLKELGTTTDPNEAGYIKPDGTLADLSGKREGADPGERIMDHREAGGTAGMQEVIAYGWVRMDENSGMLDIAKLPTSQQLSAISKMADRHNGELVVDLEDGLGEWSEGDEYYRNPPRRWSKEYPSGTSPRRIVNDIKKFFGGDTPNTLFQRTGPRWHSKARTLITDKMESKASPQQVLNMLKNSGISQDELFWSGLEELLGGASSLKSVTKEEVLTALDNGFELKEVVLPDLKAIAEWDAAVEKQQELSSSLEGIREEVRQALIGKGIIDETFPLVSNPQTIRPGSVDYKKAVAAGLKPVLDKYHAALNAWADYELPESPNAGMESGKFSQYTLPAGENYQEMVFTTGDDYESPHYPGVKGYNGHMRWNERVDADGKRVMFLEEIQNDRHQEGRKKGYRPEKEKRFAALVARRDELLALGKDATESQKKEWAAVSNEISDLAREDVGVPDAPFKKTWHMLAMKRAIQYAAENGFDRIAWTTGSQQAERYDLSQKVDRIVWRPKDNDLTALKDGQEVISRTVTKEELPDVIGKEAAERLIANYQEDYLGAPGHVIEGVDLKVGGEGMKAFYDKMLPNEVNKFIKKFGAKVGQTAINQAPGMGTFKGEDFAVEKDEESGTYGVYDTESDSVIIGNLDTYDDAVRAMSGMYILVDANGKNIGEGPWFDAQEAMEFRDTEVGDDSITVVQIGKDGSPQHSFDITPAMRDSALAHGQPLFQKQRDQEGTIQAWTHFVNASKAIIGATDKADVSSFFHEIGHPMRKFLFNKDVSQEERGNITDADIDYMEEFLGVEDGNWTRPNEERFVDALMKYWREGKHPNKQIESIFQKISAWLSNVLSVLQRDIELDGRVRAIFDKVHERGGIDPKKLQALKGEAAPEASKKDALAEDSEAEFGDDFAEIFGETAAEESVEATTVIDATKPAIGQMTSGSITEVPTADINVAPDRFQFKTGVSETTGTVEGEELQGDWDAYAAGVVLLWQDSDGKLWAVNGHHRVELARRKNVPAMTSRIVKETDGVTESEARAMGAKLNILEGQGKVEDYAEFFRATQTTEADAERQGLLARAKGKTGFMVGRFASEDVWAGYRAGKLSAAQAAAIAEIGKGDDGLQVVGIELARKGQSAELIKTTLQAYKLFSGSPKATQLDLFGFDDSAIRESEAISRAINGIIQSLKDRLLSVKGYLKRPEQAKEMGLEGNVPAIRVEADKIQEELDRWSRWTTDRELIDQARIKAGLDAGPDTLFQSQADTNRQVVQLAKDALKDGAATYEDYVDYAVQEIGEDQVKAIAPSMEKFWGFLRTRPGYEYLPPAKPVEAPPVSKKLEEELDDAEIEIELEEESSDMMSQNEDGPTTGTKYARTEGQRLSVSDTAREWYGPRDVEERQQQAIAELAANPGRVYKIITQMEAKPRPLTDREDALLNARIRELKNDGDIQGDDRQEWLDINRTVQRGHSEWGYAGHAAQVELSSDFSIEGLTRKHTRDVGSDPTPEQMAKYQEMADKTASLEGELDAIKKKMAQEEVDRAIAEAAAAAKKPPPPTSKQGTKKATLQKKASEAVESFKSAWAKLSQMGAISDPRQQADKWIEVTKAAGSVIKAYAELYAERGLSFLKLMASVKQDIGNLEEYQVEAFKEAWETHKKGTKVESPLGDNPENAAIGRFARDLTRWAVESDIVSPAIPNDVDDAGRYREEIVDVVHQELQDMEIEITRSETKVAMSGYGDFRELPKDEVSVIVRDIKAQIQLVLKIEDMEAGQAPRKSGVERPEQTEAQRILIKEVNERKKKGGYEVTDPEKQLATSLGTAKKAVNNRLTDLDAEIEELEQSIATRQPRTVAERTLPPTDAELDQLRERAAEKRKQRDELKAEYNKIFPQKKSALTDAYRLKAAEALLTRQIAELQADIDAGRLGPKDKRAPLTSDVLTAKKEELAVLKEVRDQARLASPEYQAKLEAKKTAQYKKSLEKQLAFWETRRDDASQGKLPEKRKSKTPVDNEILEKKWQIEQVKRQATAEIENAIRAARGPAMKALGFGGDLLDLARAMQTGYESSAVLRQGAVYFGGFPIKASRALLKSAEAAFSRRADFAHHDNLLKRDYHLRYMAGGLETTAADGPLSHREESIRSRLASWLSQKEGWAWAVPRWAIGEGVLASERAFRTFSNIMRADLFDYMAGIVEANRPGTWTDDDAKIIAHASNVFSGRAPLKHSVAWGRFMYAPRWVWSRALLTVGEPLWKGDKATRLAIGKVYVRGAIGMATILGIKHVLYTLLADDDEHKPKYEFDPRSSDFGKMRLGDTRIDSGAGINQLITVATRLGKGETKRQSGEIVDLRGDDVPFGANDTIDVAGRFLRTKLAPLPSGVLDWIAGKNVVGDDATAVSIVTERLTPMTWADIWDAEKELNVPQGTVAAIEAFFGSGLGTYGPKTKYRRSSEDERKKQFEKDLENMQWNTTELPYSDMLAQKERDMVVRRREEKKEDLVVAALHEPIKKDYKTEESYQKAVKKRDNAMEKMKEAGWRKEEIRALLLNYWKSRYGSIYDGDDIRDAAARRLRKLNKLFPL